MKKNVWVIPFITSLFVVVILLNIPVIRPIMIFAYLSFVPGFVMLKTFKLKELGLLDTFLLSVGLSLVVSMFVGLLVNQLCLMLGFLQPLSFIPLTVAISTFTLIVFFIGYKRDFSINFVSLDGLLRAIRSYLPLILVLIILPILSIVGALYVNIPIMIILCLAIGILCISSVASDKIIPSKYYPFLIFSISISILLLNLLLSKYTIGDDSSVEYYVFRVTQIRGYWGPINVATNSWMALVYNSMLSVTLLPTIYSVLMNLQNEMLFKILYSFIFSLVPVALYGMYKRETSKLIGLLSVLFFVFSIRAFFGELTRVNRQIVGEFFLVLSISLWLDKTLPIKGKRILLIIFGVAIAVSHYSLAIIYLLFVSLIVIISKVKRKFDYTFDAYSILTIFGITFLWYAFSNVNLLIPIINTVQSIFAELTVFQYAAGAGSISAVTSLPETVTLASEINLIVTIMVHILLAIGIFAVILLSREMKISNKYKLITILTAILLFASVLFPMVALTLNFTRFYAISLLFLSVDLPIGALTIQKIVRSIFRKRQRNQRNNIAFMSKHGKKALFLVALLLFAYFLSQSGFVNYVTEGAISSPTFDYYRMKTSSDPRIQTQFLGYIQEQDASSAFWLSKHANDLSIIYADLPSSMYVLVSCALIPINKIEPLTNMTRPEQGSFIYLDSGNVVKGIIPTSTGMFNTSEIAVSLNESNLIYSNGNSEVWSGTGPG
jgi:uncharacterized membrane protein